MPTNYDRAAIEIDRSYTTPVSYSTLTLFDNIPHKDQIEVYRKNIETIWETANSPTQLTLTRNEKNNFGIVKPEWITYDTVNKTITGITIPTNSLFTRDDGSTLVYPAMSGSEALRIKRKTINYDTLVEWVNGSRITADQLNLLASQLLGIGQENLHELEKNVIKTSDAGVEYATPTYVDQQISNIQSQISAGSSLSDGTNYDQRFVYLVRNPANTQNVLTVLNDIKWNDTNNTLSIYLTGATQTNNVLEFKTSTDTLVNYFNGRGVLNQAGRIYYGSSAPSPAPNAADTGLLWWDTSVSLLKVWNSSAWDTMPTNANSVSIDTTQTVTGQKTFTATNTYIGNSTAGTGTNLFTKTVIVRPEATAGTTSIIKASEYPGDSSASAQTLSIRPWNGSSHVAALNVSPTQVVVPSPIELGFSVLTATAKTVVATLADTQTISGQKTFSSSYNYFTGDGGIVLRTTTAESGIKWAKIITNIAGDSPTPAWSDTANTGGFIFRNALSTNSQYIIMNPDWLNNSVSTRPGIVLRPKNPSGNGELVIDGNMRVSGDIIFDTGTRGIRNVGAVRIPGQWGSISSPYNSTSGFHRGLFTIPEGGTVTYVATTTTISITIVRPNNAYAHTYRFHGYTGGTKNAFASYRISYSSNNSSGNVYSPNQASPIDGSFVVTLPAGTTNDITISLTKATTGTEMPYLEWCIQ